MLIAGIDRNKETEPEKQISRIISPYWTMPVDRELQNSTESKRNPTEIGKVLRVGNRRKMDRRANRGDESYLKKNHNRRLVEKRKTYYGWSPETHDILVVAVEKKPGQFWKEGDGFVIRSGKVIEVETEKKINPPPEDISKSPLLVKNDEDYVLHLSNKPASE